GDDQADALVGEEFQGFCGRRGAHDLVARAGEHRLDHLADDRLVVDDENLRHDSSPARGSLRTNVVPPPTAETVLSSPACARAIWGLAARASPVVPRPVPVTLAPPQSPSRSSRTVAAPPACCTSTSRLRTTWPIWPGLPWT